MEAAEEHYANLHSNRIDGVCRIFQLQITIFCYSNISRIHINLLHQYLQWCALENQQSPFYVVNEVTLRGQNPSLKFCYPLELYTYLKMVLDLLLLKIWSL